MLIIDIYSLWNRGKRVLGFLRFLSTDPSVEGRRGQGDMFIWGNNIVYKRQFSLEKDFFVR